MKGQSKVGISLYLIVPCYNEEEVLNETADKLQVKIRELCEKGLITNESRIVFVNDGSADSTGKIIHDLHEENQLFSGISFSKNFGHQNAVMAGYLFAADKCDAAISIDADLQQDINAIDEFIEKFNEGNDIVYGVRNDRDADGLFKKASSQLFYGVMKMLGCKTIPNHADYRLLSNKVLKVLEEYKESNVFLRGLIPELGFKSAIVYFDVRERTAGKSKYSLKKMMNLALDGITSHSIKPMHIIFWMGWIILIPVIICLIYTLVVYLKGDGVPGWTTIVMSIWGFGGIQLIAIGCVGEYVGKSYLESKKRPRYIIEGIEHNS